MTASRYPGLLIYAQVVAIVRADASDLPPKARRLPGSCGSLSIFLAGFAVGQLLWGPLSDRIGRKPVLLIGLSLFVLGCLGMFWVQSAPQLWALRFIQAIGVCSATVSWQALVIDRYAADKAHRVFAGIIPLMSLSPALAPLLGAHVSELWGWRAIFAVLLGISLLLLLLTFGLKSPPKRLATDKVPSRLGYGHLLTSRVFTGNVMIYAASSAGFFAWLTASPLSLVIWVIAPVILV